MNRDVKVLQAAIDNLLRRGLLPAECELSLRHAEAYVHALTLSADQLPGWARDHHTGYSVRHLTSLVMSVGASSGSLKKKEQQELVATLSDIAAAAERA